MNYKGMQVELGPEIIKTALGRQEIDQTSELIRKKFVWAMRAGDKLCFDIENTKPDFGGQLRVYGTFDPDIFFDYRAMNQRHNFISYVREYENHGPGGINPGSGYVRKESFAMIIRSCAENEQVLREQISKIPRFASDFKPIIIERSEIIKANPTRRQVRHEIRDMRDRN